MSRLWSDSVDDVVSAGRIVSHSYSPRESVIRLLSEDTVYIKSDMDTDADGSPRAIEIDPRYGQLETSLSKWNGWKGDSDYVNSETVPYVVLPKNFYSVCGVKCKLGDLALIRWRNQEVFAIYADQGPNDLIGEGSIKAVESLGGNPWNANKTLIVSGIPFGVEYIIFAQSTALLPIPSTFDEIQRIGETVFIEAFGSPSSVEFSMTPEEMRAKSGDDDIEVWDIMNAPVFITSTGLNLRRGVGTKSPIITAIPANTVVKTKICYKPQGSKVVNVGADHNGLWIMVAYENHDGFVRASTRYLNPKWSDDPPSVYVYTSLPFLNGKTRDKELTDQNGRDFYEHGIVPLCNNGNEFKKAIIEGYEEVPWARHAPCATTTSAVLEYAFRYAGMLQIAALFNNHGEYGPTHNVEIMLYRLGFRYWLKNTCKSQKGAVGLMAGRYTWHGTPRHSGHIYTIFSEIDEKYDLIGDNTGFNHRYRGPGYEAGTEGFWLPPGVEPERRRISNRS